MVNEVPRPTMNMRLVDESGNMTREAQRFFIQLWERTGGATDNVGGSLQAANNLSDLDSATEAVENLGFDDPILDKKSPGSIGGDAPASGSFLQFDATNLANDANGNVIAGGALLATTATDGFLYVPTTAGNPTGVPSAKAGRVPLVFDTSC